MRFIEFDYETIDGKILTIQGEANDSTVTFKAFDYETQDSVSKKTLLPYDIENIEDFIYDNSAEVEYESDYYNRYDS